MICERCGHEIASNSSSVLCLVCGTLVRRQSSALAAEFILSLLGIFGVGWLLIGEMVTGTLLLVGSILVYWPLMILCTRVTLGFGLMCLGPLAVGCVICNALLLNRCLRRKAAWQQQ
jgi:hypothetical protein